MLDLRARTAARRRAFALVTILVFVWCQVVAAAHATTMAAAGVAGEHSGADMAEMVGCDGLPDTGADGGSDCPTEDATSDSGKFPVFFPLPAAAPFTLLQSRASGPSRLDRYAFPQGQAPPRTRLCSWLI
jgi:hypothetical protein